eukprot:4250031-Prymnesium_polylepis.2
MPYLGDPCPWPRMALVARTMAISSVCCLAPSEPISTPLLRASCRWMPTLLLTRLSRYNLYSKIIVFRVSNTPATTPPVPCRYQSRERGCGLCAPNSIWLAVRSLRNELRRAAESPRAETREARSRPPCVVRGS